MMLPSDERIKIFQRLTNQTLYHYLGPGPGQDGFVLKTSHLTAAKFFDRGDRYRRERDVYRILSSKHIDLIADHNVPQLIREYDDIRVLELTIVEPPFVLDFAGAKRWREIHDFPPEVMDEHHQHLEELFGPRWTDALHVAEMFRLATGYTLLDIHPGNIAFADEPG